MPLMNCPECNQQVSGRAKACPKCAYPINPSVRPATPGAPLAASAAVARVQTVEQTSKALKGQVLASVLLVMAGTFMTCASAAAEAPGFGAAAGLLAFAGVVWFIVTRIRIWWHHE
jgi:proline racemase